MKQNHIVCPSIAEVMRGMQSMEYVLPAIQRDFVWTEQQIERLFDSLMRGYPINTFMFWKLNQDTMQSEIKNSTFYKFLDKYIETYGESNTQIDNVLSLRSPFYAVIDGQQRLTALYMGLCGSYASKIKYKRDNGVYSSDIYPTKYLYLNIEAPAPSNEENLEYEFKFLTTQEASLNPDKWFKMHDIMGWSQPNSLVNWGVQNHSLQNKDYAINTLSQLREVVHSTNNVLNAFEISEADIDTVLEIFIRTNSGGTKLSFSDLLMSFTINKWQRTDAKNDFKTLREQIRAIAKNNPFNVDNDLILKCCLMVFSQNDVKSRLKNFDDNVICEICNNWSKLSKCIVESFKLLHNYYGIDAYGLRAYNAIVPIVYFVYKYDLQNEIASPTIGSNIHYIDDVRTNIKKWLAASLLKSVFSNQSDNFLKKLRDIIDAQKQPEPYFPFKEIKDAFKTDDSKNLEFSKEKIDELLETQYMSPLSFSIMALLYPAVIANGYSGVNQDHLHPKVLFEHLKKETIYQSWTSEEQSFAEDKKNWNSIVNLQLLDSRTNKSKTDDSLEKWLKERKDLINKVVQFIPETDGNGAPMNYGFSNFKAFIEARRDLLKQELTKILK